MKDRYDVIIIGAGMGGLIAGTYLSKFGFKVTIFDRHYQAGGYCTSYVKSNLQFSVSVLQDCAKDDPLGSILDELGIYSEISIKRRDPSINILNMEYEVPIHNNFDVTISNICSIFPSEKDGIVSFFNYIKDASFAELYINRRISMKYYVDKFLKSPALKCLVYQMFAQLGTLPQNASSLTSIMYFRNLILKGGYYLDGGSQELSDSIVNKFKEYGGALFLLTPVKKILVDSGRATGVLLKNGAVVKSDFVISACDIKETFFNLIGKGNYPDDKLFSRIDKCKPSISLFTLDLETNKKITDYNFIAENVWFTSANIVEDPWDISRFENGAMGFFVFAHMPTKNTFSNACNVFGVAGSVFSIFIPFISTEYWRHKKEMFTEIIFNKISHFLPDYKSIFKVVAIATPNTYKKFTNNQAGAMRGWAPEIDQIEKDLFPQDTAIDNFLLAGHWVSTPAGEAGLPMAAYTGRKAANKIRIAYKQKLVVKK